jgi:hypothetical protein
MAQIVMYPFMGFATPSANTEYVIASLSAQSNVPFEVLQVLIGPEATVSTDAQFRYRVGVASGAGTPGTSITGVQVDQTMSIPSSFFPTGTQWGSGTPPTLSSAQDVASLASSSALFRNYADPQDITVEPLKVKEGTTFCITANILGSANGNVKFSGFVKIRV